MQCSSCRGTCVLNVCYKVLNNVLQVPYAEEILGDYRHGFRKGWLTTDNFDVLLTVHLSIFISLFNELDAQNFVHQVG